MSCHTVEHNLSGRTICLDPGHGGTATIDSFRVGPTSEREEWINLRVALELKSLLEAKNCTVLLTRSEDRSVALKDRALLAVDNQVDVFLSIHHNATADSSVNFPIVYFHGNASENKASVQLGKCIVKQLLNVLYQNKSNYSLVSDHTIFPTSGTAVLRQSYGIPGIIGEASFFTHPPEEKRLKTRKFNLLEAQAYMKALEDYFSMERLPIENKSITTLLPPYPVLQESDRMNPLALLWRHDFYQAVDLLNFQQNDSLQKSFNLFSRSASTFPDSWIAGQAHLYRAQILEKQKKYDEAKIARRRVIEHYIRIN